MELLQKFLNSLKIKKKDKLIRITVEPYNSSTIIPHLNGTNLRPEHHKTKRTETNFIPKNLNLN
ncbi:MAG: hypothetical protein U0T58_00290 [Buchnera aphidicola (Meitanaphis elongallis)]